MKKEKEIEHLTLQNVTINKQDSEDVLCICSGETPVRGKGFLSLNIANNDKSFLLQFENNQVEIEMYETVAIRIAEVLIEMLGQMSAMRSMYMIAKEKRENAEFEKRYAKTH